MKLKNSYFLLIVMAIFLLVSVGSVCASENTSINSLADDGSNVVLGDETTDDVKIDTTIIAEDTKVQDNESKVIPVTVNDNESKSIENITQSELNVLEGNKTIGFTYNASKITITDNLEIGNHSLIINYLGNDLYKNSTKSIILSIFGNYTMQTPDSVTFNSTKIVEVPVNITEGVDLKDVTSSDFEINLTYADGNDTISVPVEGLTYGDGKISFSYPLLDNITSANMTIVYTGDKSLNKTIALNRIYNVKVDEIINNKTEYQSGTFSYKLIDTDLNEPLTNKTIKLSYSIKTGTITFQQTATGDTDSEGIVKFNNSNMYLPPVSGLSDGESLGVGTHEVTLSADGMNIENATQTVEITKATINIKIDKFKEYYGTNKNVTITVTNAKTGDPVKYTVIHLNMPQTTGKNYYFQTDVNGQSKIAVSGLVGGTYNLTVNNNDTQNMSKKSVKGFIQILPVSVKLTVKTSTISYNTGNTATITVTNSKTGKAVSGTYVLVIFDKKTTSPYLFQTNSKGQVTFAASLGVGKHSMAVSTADTRYSGKSVTKTITVKKASGKLSAAKVTSYYKQGKYFTVKLVNTKNKKAIYDAKVNIRIYVSKTSYYNYNGNTGANGQLKLLVDLNPGTYKVEVRSGASKNYTASKITSKIVVKKAPTKLIPTKLTAKKGVKKYFKVTVKNTKTKKVIKGVKVKIKVYTGKKYKTYTVKTNSKGIAQINVKSLKVGTHNVVVTSANKYCVAKTAKSTIKITKK